MIRKLLVASISVVALSMGAAAFASPANAESFFAGEYPATVTGKGTSEFKISNGARSITCTNVGVTGKLASSSEELQLTPSLPKCTTSEGLFVAFTNESKWDIHFLRWTFFHIIPDWFIKYTLKWRIDIWTTEKASKEEKPPLCTFEVPEAGNTAVEVVTGTNEGSETGRHLLAEVNVSNLLINRTAGTEALCGKEKQTEGTMTGKFDLTASKEGKEVGLWFE